MALDGKARKVGRVASAEVAKALERFKYSSDFRVTLAHPDADEACFSVQ